MKTLKEVTCIEDVTLAGIRRLTKGTTYKVHSIGGSRWVRVFDDAGDVTGWDPSRFGLKQPLV